MIAKQRLFSAREIRPANLLLTIVCAIFFVFAGAAWSAIGPTEEDKAELPRKWQTWLKEEIGYIISDPEREVFLQLSTEEQRQAFVDGFWLSRDPSPGTERNEFRNEHMERLAYANRVFSRDSVKPGWMTDRGKMHIILGKPQEIQQFPGSSAIYPTELWFYQGDITKKLPTFFYLMFFKYNNSGEYRLYQHGLNRPRQLTGDFRTDDDQYTILRRVSPEVAHAAFTYLVDEYPSKSESATSLRSVELIANIDNTRNIDADATYAEQILSGQVTVATQYAFDSTPIAASILPFLDPEGRGFIDIAIELLPEQIDMGQLDDNYYGAFEINSYLAGPGGGTILSVSREVEMNMGEDRFRRIEKSPMVYLDRLACLPGEYTLSVRINNKVSKKYYLINEKVTFAAANPVSSGVSSLFLAKAMHMPQSGSPVTYHPFSLYKGAVSPQPLQTFAADEPPYIYCQMYLPPETRSDSTANPEVRITITDQNGTVSGVSTSTVQAGRFNQFGIYDFFLRLPTQGFAPGTYDARVDVNFGGDTLERTIRFSIADSAVPKPLLMVRKNRPQNTTGFFMDFTDHLLQVGAGMQANNYLQSALAYDPSNTALRLMTSTNLIDLKRFDKALEVLQPVVIAEPNNLGMLEIAKNCYWEMGDFSNAARYLERLRAQDGDTVERLNKLAEAYVKLGNAEKAQPLWEKSLQLQPEQPRVKEMLEK